MRTYVAVALAMVALCLAACAPARDDAPAVATPSLRVSRAEAAAGRPLDLTFRFAVASDAPAFSEDLIVFVHFLDTSGDLLWTDDHRPATPTTQWKPGATVEYTRTLFVPTVPYVGDVTVQMGLYTPGSNTRLPLAAETPGGRAYRVASFRMLLQPDPLEATFGDGWQALERDEGGTLEWRWSTRSSAFRFANPARDATLMLLVDMPVPGLGEPQRVEVRLGSTTVDAFTLGAGQRELRRIPLTTAQMGAGSTVEMSIAVDRTFIPAALPHLKSPDTRELGARVLRVYVEPNAGEGRLN